MVEVTESNVKPNETPGDIQAEADKEVKEILDSASPDDAPAELAAKAIRAGVATQNKTTQEIGETMDRAAKGDPEAATEISEATNRAVEDLSTVEAKPVTPKPQTELIAADQNILNDVRNMKLVSDIEEIFNARQKNIH